MKPRNIAFQHEISKYLPVRVNMKTTGRKLSLVMASVSDILIYTLSENAYNELIIKKIRSLIWRNQRIPRFQWNFSENLTLRAIWRVVSSQIKSKSLRDIMEASWSLHTCPISFIWLQSSLQTFFNKLNGIWERPKIQQWYVAGVFWLPKPDGNSCPNCPELPKFGGW